MKAWLLLQFGENRQFAGNRGYADRSGRIYSYDSLVPNHKQLSAGDVIFLADHGGLLAVGVINRIRSREGSKELRRCPICTTTAIKEREKTPIFRCNRGHVFTEPVVDPVNCLLFEAEYDTVQLSLPDEGVDLMRLRQACVSPHAQLAMRPLAPAAAERLIVELGIQLPASKFGRLGRLTT